MELTWDELELVYHESGRPMFRSELRKRDKDGKVGVVKPVRVWIPTPADLIAARVEARGWFKQMKLDPQLDVDMFEEMEQICVLARAIRTDKAPHGQEMTYDELALWDDGPIKDIQERINLVRTMLDPRDPIESEEQMWAATLKVAKRGNLGPLADTAGHEQSSCIVFMARQACFSPRAPSSVQSFASSILARSPSMNSEES